jgi:hypothetical protein
MAEEKETQAERRVRVVGEGTRSESASVNGYSVL